MEQLFGSLDSVLILLAVLTLAGFLFEVGRYAFSRLGENSKAVITVVAMLIVAIQLLLVILRAL